VNTKISNNLNEFENFTSIFSTFINPTDNTSLTTLTKKDINQLIYLLTKYHLSYRQTLNFNNNFTFGLEIEFKKRFFYHKLSMHDIYINIREITSQKDWETKYDGSLLKNGVEVNSPILTDTIDTWKQLKKILIYLNKIGYIDETCGGHIHIGSQVIGPNYQTWENFIKIWIVYENIILRFFSGEYSQLRPKFYTWAPPINKVMYDSYKQCQKKYQNQITEPFLKYFWYLLGGPRQTINFQNITSLLEVSPGNTIEFRSPNGTLNPIIWQNNINLILKLLTYPNNPNFNQLLLTNKFHYLDSKNIYISNQYQTIDIPLAIEFCDLIFDNNLDKINFLKQYLKNLKTTKKYTPKKIILTNK